MDENNLKQNNDFFKEEKQEYEDIEVPDELLFLVRRTVAEDRRKKAVKRRNYMLRAAGSVAAAVLLGLCVGVNSSYSFAKTAVKMPVVTSVAKAMIVRSYKAEVITAAEKEIQEKKLQRQQEKQAQEQQEQQEQGAEEAALAEEQQTDAEAAAAVSANDTISPAEETLSSAEQQEETAQGFDAWASGLTIEELKGITELYTSEMEKRYADTPEKLKTILLAELPEKDISLYGYHENGAVKGVALRSGERFACYDWRYWSGSEKLPELYCVDMDGDGTEELAVLLYNQGISAEEILAGDITEAGSDGKEVSGQVESETAGETGNKTENGIGSTATGNETENEAGSTAGSKTESEAGSTQNTESESSGTAKNSSGEVTGKQTGMPEDVSGNDTEQQPSETATEKTYENAAEIRIVSLEGDTWKTSVFSVNEQESRILRQLKADYDEEKQALQLYLMEEPLGERIFLKDILDASENSASDKEAGEAVFEKLQPVFKEYLVTEDGITLRFAVDAVCRDENGEEEYLRLEPELEVDVDFEGDAFTLENIKVRN